MHESKLKQLLKDHEPELPAIDTNKIAGAMISHMESIPQTAPRSHWTARSVAAMVAASLLIACCVSVPQFMREPSQQLGASPQPLESLNSISLAADELETELLEQLLINQLSDLPENLVNDSTYVAADHYGSIDAMQAKIRASESLYLLAKTQENSKNTEQLLETLYPKTPAFLRFTQSSAGDSESN